LINNPKSSGSLCVLEYPSSTGEPYYPVPNKRNQDLYQKYLEIVDELDFGYKVHFIGRLAGYKYINMDQAIYNALEYFENNFIKK
jgi:UDP-galactopyranose mutase